VWWLIKANSSFKKKLTLFIFICSCLHYFYSNERLQLYVVDCRRINNCDIWSQSDDDKWLSFNNYNKKEHSICRLCWFRILEKADSDQEASTRMYHQVFSIEYYIRQFSIKISISSRSGLHFMVHRKTEKFSTLHKKILAANVPMETLSSEQWETLRSATHCHVCEKSFALDDNRVSNNYYLTGRYRGPTHSNCNLNYKKTSYFIPIVFHNLSGYDSHIIYNDYYIIIKK